MGHQANRIRSKRTGEHTARLQTRGQFGCTKPSPQSEDDDIGLDCFEIDGNALGVRQRLSQ